MVYIPGCPSLTDVEKYGGPNPYPGNISEFDAAILRYDTHVKDALSHLARNTDCEKRAKGRIRQAEIYIARNEKLAAELRRKGKLKDADEVMRNVANEREELEEARQVLALLPAHKSDWAEEAVLAQIILTNLRLRRRAGLDKNGDPRLCRSRNTTDKSPCQNPMHFRPASGWGPCTVDGH